MTIETGATILPTNHDEWPSTRHTGEWLFFVDTSAILALMVGSDRAHREAAEVFEKLRSRQAALVTTSYVLVETYALIDRRLGRDAVRDFRARFVPLIRR